MISGAEQQILNSYYGNGDWRDGVEGTVVVQAQTILDAVPEGTILTSYHPTNTDIHPYPQFYEGGYVIPSQYTNYIPYGSTDMAYLVANLTTAGVDLPHYQFIASGANYAAVGTEIPMACANGVIKPSNNIYYYPFTYEEITPQTRTFDLLDYINNVAVRYVYDVCYDELRNIRTGYGITYYLFEIEGLNGELVGNWANKKLVQASKTDWGLTNADYQYYWMPKSTMTLPVKVFPSIEFIGIDDQGRICGSGLNDSRNDTTLASNYIHLDGNYTLYKAPAGYQEYYPYGKTLMTKPVTTYHIGSTMMWEDVPDMFADPYHPTVEEFVTAYQSSIFTNWYPASISLRELLQGTILLDITPYVADERVWLSYNKQTAISWVTDFHYTTAGWNNINSYLAYKKNVNEIDNTELLNIVSTWEDKEQTDPYFCLMCLFNDPDNSNDSALGTPIANYNYALGNGATGVYSVAVSQQLGKIQDNLGAMIGADGTFFIADVVSSYDRNAYPDYGNVGRLFYKLRPQDTTFIQYTTSTTELLNVELYKDRDTYSHNNTYIDRDTSLYGTVVGTAQSTNEDSIPDASWRKYCGVYLGDSVPSLNIVEDEIPPSEILGVPTYDKQINTSDTLKYGTVASAATTFVLNMPVDEAMAYNNKMLILFYDFKHDGVWTRMGFFYVDSVEAIDEYTTRITAHDEAYKLNKYVDDFLKAFYEPITLRNFFLELLDYCECDYDTNMPSFLNGTLVLDNVYDAVKTTGTEVAHYVASIIPAFIHANIDGDIVVGQYRDSHQMIGINDYTDLRYVAYNSDIVNRVKITSSNNVIAEDTHGTGENYYYLADNPLINTSWGESTLTDIANTIEMAYRNLTRYRPATIRFLVMPDRIGIGDYFDITTITNQTYCVYVMSIKIDGTGIEIESMGTQQFPVESSGNSQFINVLNDLGNISSDISGLDNTVAATTSEVQQLAATVSAMGTAVSNTVSSVSTLAGTVSTLSERMGLAEGHISATASTVSSLSSTVSAMTISTTTDFATVSINGNTVSDIARKDYVDAKITGLFTTSTSIWIGDELQMNGLLISAQDGKVYVYTAGEPREI